MKNTEKANQLLTRTVEIFGNQSFPEVAAAAYLEKNGTPSDAWSWHNRLLMLFAGTRDARGFMQWQKADRHVKSGAKATYILGPRMATVKAKNEEEGKEEEEDRKILVGFRSIPVFRYEDTEGEPITYVKNKPARLPQLSEVATKWGISVTYDGTQSGEYGSFEPGKDEIRLCTSSEAVFFHELAHVAHRRVDGKLKVGQDPEQEAVAELSACILARLYGADMAAAEEQTARSWHYIAHYADGKNPEDVGKLCAKVLAKTKQVLDEILAAA